MSLANNPLAPSLILRALPRAVDDLPLWAQLNITYKCNLDCAYCTEYDNAKDHVPYEILLKRIDKCHELGTLHTDMIGGEPMLHPDLVRLMRYIRQKGMTTGMTTNGFLLTEERLQEMMDAGMGRIQISVDALKPSRATPKSLKTLAKKIEMVAKYPIWFRVNTVICEQTIDEVEQVAEFCFERGVGINFSVVHDRGRLKNGDLTAKYLDKVRWLKDQKKRGRDIFTPYFLIRYYEDALMGKPMDWTCLAGSKCYYVSPEGHFQFCFHIPSDRDFMQVTRKELSSYTGKKGCEENCGVDCVINTVLPYSNKLDVLRIEASERLSAAKERIAGMRLPILG